MTDKVCSSCLRSKTSIPCELCQSSVCKDCRQVLEEATFSFLEKIPEELSHTYYCSPCYEEKVQPAIVSYQETMELAKGVFIFFTSQRKAIPMVRRSKETLRIEDCEDRDETILRMAFRAAEMGYNAVIEAKVTAKKIRNAGYQKNSWSGVGVPAEVKPEVIARWSE